MLTTTQIEQRRGKLTASRVGCLMRGDADAIMQLYREMIGEAEPEDMSAVWPVRVGEATEALNLEWFERRNHTPLSRYGEVCVHPEYPWAACTLDAWVDELACPIECKHVGGREPFEIVIDRYQPQLQYQMAITGARQCVLSVIMGASEPVIEFIERDQAYIDELIKRAAQFMFFVLKRQPPVVLPPAPPPVSAQKIYDMNANSDWQRMAGIWLQTHGAAEAAHGAEKVLKALVPDDAKLCEGAGIRISRDRAGRLSLREAKHE